MKSNSSSYEKQQTQTPIFQYTQQSQKDSQSSPPIFDGSQSSFQVSEDNSLSFQKDILMNHIPEIESFPGSAKNELSTFLKLDSQVSLRQSQKLSQFSQLDNLILTLREKAFNQEQDTYKKQRLSENKFGIYINSIEQLMEKVILSLKQLFKNQDTTKVLSDIADCIDMIYDKKFGLGDIRIEIEQKEKIQIQQNKALFQEIEQLKSKVQNQNEAFQIKNENNDNDSNLFSELIQVYGDNLQNALEGDQLIGIQSQISNELKQQVENHFQIMEEIRQRLAQQQKTIKQKQEQIVQQAQTILQQKEIIQNMSKTSQNRSKSQILMGLFSSQSERSQSSDIQNYKAIDDGVQFIKANDFLVQTYQSSPPSDQIHYETFVDKENTNIPMNKLKSGKNFYKTNQTQGETTENSKNHLKSKFNVSLNQDDVSTYLSSPLRHMFKSDLLQTSMDQTNKELDKLNHQQLIKNQQNKLNLKHKIFESLNCNKNQRSNQVELPQMQKQSSESETKYFNNFDEQYQQLKAKKKQYSSIGIYQAKKPGRQTMSSIIPEGAGNNSRMNHLTLDKITVFDEDNDDQF
ncbi:UNKNOWN [Stylonychia lemnae]|uniref:Uncharacterized protein n=1 Tax=Stylonychia lemnae TaxID=5949 RepID=A0A078B8K1_STYLE|nr:UNKNOWN [Stylonychia lemnae]|eukprot:CDW90526.1 UNKNOWN [Stylonychia lemnae]